MALLYLYAFKAANILSIIVGENAAMGSICIPFWHKKRAFRKLKDPLYRNWFFYLFNESITFLLALRISDSSNLTTFLS